MERTQQGQRDRQQQKAVSRRPAPASRHDRRHHERAAAIREFQNWDKAMVQQHGWDYRRQMNWTLH
jgi:hypothetical protein